MRSLLPSPAQETFLDGLYARLANRRKVFPKGWGNWEILHRAGQYFPEAATIEITWEAARPVPGGEAMIGTFRSPWADLGLPVESQTARIEWLLPAGWTSATPVAIHFAATGDAGFERRRVLGFGLLARGVSSVILENPFYGTRRPDGQLGTQIRSVSDLWCMGMALWEEGRALLAWLQRRSFRNLGVCGISLGGQIASHVAALWPGPVAVATLVAPHSGVVVYVDGILSRHLDRQQLQILDAHASVDETLSRVLEPTDIRLFPVPVRPDACIRIGALFDAYVPPKSVDITHQAWPGSDLRWIRTGHVRAVAYRGGELIGPLCEAFARL